MDKKRNYRKPAIRARGRIDRVTSGALPRVTGYVAPVPLP